MSFEKDEELQAVEKKASTLKRAEKLGMTSEDRLRATENVISS